MRRETAAVIVVLLVGLFVIWQDEQDLLREQMLGEGEPPPAHLKPAGLRNFLEMTGELHCESE